MKFLRGMLGDWPCCCATLKLYTCYTTLALHLKKTKGCLLLISATDEFQVTRLSGACTMEFPLGVVPFSSQIMVIQKAAF